MSLDLQAAFFRQVGLPAAWAGRQQWTFLDTDFQEGVRFLLLWELWKQDPHRSARLHVVGLLPVLHEPELLRERLLAQLPDTLRDKVTSLLDVWPLGLAGMHRMDFEGGAVTLTLGVGPAPTLLSRLHLRADVLSVHAGALGDLRVDPVRSVRVLSRLALADATAVMPIADLDCLQALVSAGLLGPSGPLQSMPASKISQDFCVTYGVCAQPSPSDAWDQRSHPDARQAIVVGAGFAGLSVARALALRGWQVMVFDPDWRQDGARPHAGHVAAALTPVVSRDDNVRARLSRAGSLRACAGWRHFPDAVVTRCGAIQLQRVSGRIVDLEDVVRTLAFNPAWVRYLSPAEVAEVAGTPISRPGVFFPTAARVQPQALLSTLAATPGVTVLPAKVGSIQWQADRWLVRDAAGHVLGAAPQVVLSCGVHVRTILADSDLLESGSRVASLHALGGEITLIPQRAVEGGPRCIVGGDGYVLPALGGWCVTGSSYVHGAVSVDVTPEGAAANVRRAANLLGQSGLPAKLSKVALPGWGGWRAVLPGRLPAIGPIISSRGLWVTTGYASRGLTWSCLAADLIAAALEGEPLPLEIDLMAAMDAN